MTIRSVNVNSYYDTRMRPILKNTIVTQNKRTSVQFLKIAWILIRSRVHFQRLHENFITIYTAIHSKLRKCKIHLQIQTYRRYADRQCYNYQLRLYIWTIFGKLDWRNAIKRKNIRCYMHGTWNFMRSVYTQWK